MTVIPDDESCALCRFYLDADGTCHRGPPSVWLATASYREVSRATADRVAVTWPPVKADDWCGDFLKTKQATPVGAIGETRR